MNRMRVSGKRTAVVSAFAALFLFSGGMPAYAALLYFAPASSTFQPGETATLDLRIDPQGQCINAAGIDIGFPKDLIQAMDVSRGDSIFTLWISNPVVKQDFGVISLSGGVPGGYCGRIPGDSTLTNEIAKLIFHVPANLKNVPVDAKVSILNTSKVLLNDGEGTEAQLSTQDAILTLANTGKPQVNSWTDIIKNDKIAPEKFTVEIHQDKSIFDGKYFAVFSTVDKQSGLDRYEVAEGPKESTSTQWKETESPYVLQDQSLKGVVQIKAVDKAGNERIGDTQPYQQPKSKNWFWLWIIGFVPVIYGTAWLLGILSW